MLARLRVLVAGLLLVVFTAGEVWSQHTHRIEWRTEIDGSDLEDIFVMCVCSAPCLSGDVIYCYVVESEGCL